MKRIWLFIIGFVIMFTGCPRSIGEAQHTNTENTVANEFSEERGLELAELFRTIVNLVDADLTSNEKVIYYGLIPIHLQNLHSTDDWQRFGDDLLKCKTADDLRKILSDDYIGITIPASGRDEQEKALNGMTQFLKELELFDIFPLVYLGPLHAASNNSEAWEILGAQEIEDADRDAIMQILLTQDERVISVDALAIVGEISSFEKKGKLSQEEIEKIVDKSMRLARDYSVCSNIDRIPHPIMFDECVYQSTSFSEPLAFVWMEYASREQKITNIEDESHYGDLILVGVDSQRVYYWKSFLSKDMVHSAIENDYLLIP
ncbi:MAG: hypothetical protein IJG94_07710 [Clostridia bacterium]|nr:hypothetical protein [Clostridia bacterium]